MDCKCNTGSTKLFTMRIKKFKVISDRLIIRPYRIDDFASWASGFENRKNSKSRFDEGILPKERYSKRTFRKKLMFYNKCWAKDLFYQFGIFHKKNSEHLGSIDIAPIVRLDVQSANLGYSLHNQHWGRGYATEAIRNILKPAFQNLKLHRIEAAMETTNKRSLKVAKAAGLKLEGKRRRYYFNGTKWVDNLVFVAMADEWGLNIEKPSFKANMADYLK